MKRFTLLALCLIVIFAFFLRFVNVVSDPPSLNWDEVAIGYNAYSILKTGRDEWNQKFPLHFKSYGEYKLPVQIYASIPGIALFGLNDFGVRITPVIYGTLTVLLLYFLAKKLFNNQYVGLVSAFFLAVSPWHLQLTRASFESSFSVFWVLLGILWLIYGFERPKYWIFSGIAFALSVYTYNSARIFSPLFLLTGALIYWKDFFVHKKHVLVAALIFIGLLLPLIPFILSGQAAARYKLVSITNDAGLVPRINERRGNSKLPKPLARLVHNKVTYVAVYFTENYLAHFSPQFLFLTGAPHKQHHVQGIGELYLIQAPFLLLGLYLLFKKKNKYRYLILSWILISIIPVATTNDSIPNALRTIIVAPAYEILTAVGLVEIAMLVKDDRRVKLSFWAILIVLFSASFYKYLYQYYKVYPISYSRDWQYGNKQVVSYIKDNYNQYDLIVFSRTYGEPHMFTLFYLNWDPAKFQNDLKLNRYEATNWIWVLNFDKFYFPDLGDIGTKYGDIVKSNPHKKILFIGRPVDFPQNANKLLNINFLDGSGAFEIVDVK